MGIFDIVVIVAWVLVVVVLCMAAILLMGADWRDMWARLLRRPSSRTLHRPMKHAR